MFTETSTINSGKMRLNDILVSVVWAKSQLFCEYVAVESVYVLCVCVAYY